MKPVPALSSAGKEHRLGVLSIHLLLVLVLRAFPGFRVALTSLLVTEQNGRRPSVNLTNYSIQHRARLSGHQCMLSTPITDQPFICPPASQWLTGVLIHLFIGHMTHTHCTVHLPAGDCCQFIAPYMATLHWLGLKTSLSEQASRCPTH